MGGFAWQAPVHFVCVGAMAVPLPLPQLRPQTQVRPPGLLCARHAGAWRAQRGGARRQGGSVSGGRLPCSAVLGGRGAGSPLACAWMARGRFRHLQAVSMHCRLRAAALASSSRLPCRPLQVPSPGRRSDTYLLADVSSHALGCGGRPAAAGASGCRGSAVGARRGSASSPPVALVPPARPLHRGSSHRPCSVTMRQQLRSPLTFALTRRPVTRVCDVCGGQHAAGCLVQPAEA